MPEYVLIHDGEKFYCLLPREEDWEDSLEGCIASQDEGGKYKNKRNKKKQQKPNPAAKDEGRRRDIKTESEEAIKLRALQATYDSLRASVGASEDKVRNMQERETAVRKYAKQLESRLSRVCKKCKENTADSAFTPQERFTLTSMEDAIERLDKRDRDRGDMEQKMFEMYDNLAQLMDRLSTGDGPGKLSEAFRSTSNL